MRTREKKIEVNLANPLNLLWYLGFGALTHWFFYGVDLQGVFTFVVLVFWPFVFLYYTLPWVLVAVVVGLVVLFGFFYIQNKIDIWKLNKARNRIYDTYNK